MKNLYFKILLLFSFFALNINAQSWSAFGSGVNGDVYAMAEYNGELYVGGNFTTAGGIPASNIAKWNGTSWDSVAGGMDNDVWSLCVYNGELYAGGYFNYAGGIYSSHIARWNGTTWATAGSGMGGGVVYAMAVYNGKLFAGGNFVAADGVPANSIAQWNGTNWDSVGGGVAGPHRTVETFAIYKGKLIVGGDFIIAGGQTANYVASWNDTIWSPLGAQLNVAGTSQGVYALCEYHSKLYAGGYFDTIGNNIIANNMAVWNDTTWSEFGPNNYSYIYCMETDSSDLFVGSYYLPVNHIARWNDTAWSGLGAGANYNVITMTYYNGDLCAGGQFTHIGTINANRVARWGIPASVNENFNPEDISVYPNPANENIHVEWNSDERGKTILTLTDITGRIVLQKEIEINQNNTSTDFDIHSLSNGMYVLSVKTQTHVFSQKVIKN